MRRIVTVGLVALSLGGVLTACTKSESKSSTTTTSKSTEATTASKSDAKCLVGTWTTSAKDLGFFKNDTTSDTNFSTPKGNVTTTFTENGNFTVRFDDVTTIMTIGGISYTIGVNGSYSGTYTTNNGTFTTNTTRFNISETRDGGELSTTDLEATIKEGDKSASGFSCSGGKLTIKEDGGTSYTLSPA